MIQTTIHEVCDQMRMLGGNFVIRLGIAIIAADDTNRARLIDAFPEIIEKYDALALMARKGDA